MHIEQETCQTTAGIFQVLDEKVRLIHNKTILMLQYCKLSRHNHGGAEEWMGRLRMNVAECKYTENDR